jgi:hypothetical protein
MSDWMTALTGGVLGAAAMYVARELVLYALGRNGRGRNGADRMVQGMERIASILERYETRLEDITLRLERIELRLKQRGE